MIMGYGRRVVQNAHLLKVLLIILCVTVTGISARYVWKTGLWRECQHYSCGRGGTQYRSVFCGEEGEYKYNSVSEEHCHYMPKPKDVQECFKVCEEHYSQLRWVTTTWSKCKLNPDFKECAKNKGIQYRNVTCAWRRTGFVEDASVCLEFESRPPSKQQCDLKCPQDCVVSKFSEWHYCDTCKFLNKTRTRQLVVPPSNGGRRCPAFTEMIPCHNCTDTYTYQIGPWDECSPYDIKIPGVEKIHPLIGFQKRNIRCLNSFGSVVGYKSCIDYVSSNNDELTDRQTCIIPQDCVVSSWSPWKPLNTSCIRYDGTKKQGFMVRTRRVEKIPLGTGAPCPDLVHYFEVEDSVQKPCPKTKWIKSSWGECETPPGSLQCMTGLQTRNAICVEDEYGVQKPTSEKSCSQSRPLTSKVCRPECDLDCTVTQWTEWSECKVTDCEEYLRRRRTDEGTGQRHRTRDILMESSGSGDRCPHLSETQMCDPQPCYHWNITVEKCMLLNPNVSPACGLGTAYRTLACVNKLGLRVSDTLCEELTDRPNAQEDCNIPCPRDCILSPWSPWSDCPNMCQKGRTSPAIRLRQRTVLAQQGPGGAPCPPNRQLEEAQPCPTTIECAIYVWQTDHWGECMVQNKSKNCGDGTQTRDVNCYSLQGQLVSDQRCTLKVRPITSRGCVVPCPLDCVMTDFSDWSDCSATCWEAKQTVPVQTRLRYVLQTSRYGGKACPSTMTDVRHCTDLPICQGYYWDTAPWSKCILPLLKIPQCGRGLMVRDVNCKSENGTIQPMDVCVRHKGPFPVVSRLCFRSCDEECTFTEWSEWSRCVRGCNGNRFRTRRLIVDQDTTPNPVCLNRGRYPVDSFERCLCEDHTPVTVGNWSECILEPSSDTYYKATRSFPGPVTPEPVDPRMSGNLGVNAVCGPGKRYKVFACQNDKGEMEAANHCSLKPYQEEMCLIPCPVDCIMSDWSLWSDCSTSCETGTQMRYRDIKQKPSDGGRQCPSLDKADMETQTRICNIDCRRYQWRTYKWSVCMPMRHDIQCGNGTQRRVVRCEIVTSAGYTNEAVEEQRCYSEYKPREEQDCYSPCVGECVVSEWSSWSQCSQPCTNPHQIQVRRREVLRNPILTPGNRCPDLLDERLCIRGENCIEFDWEMTKWTSCLVNNGMVECGPGLRERFAMCRDHRGQIVDGSLCKTAKGDPIQRLIEPCKIPCDVDCLLTEWSPWTECSTTCGIGQRTRQRAVVQKQEGNGRVCPTTFDQTRPCFQQGCYSWVVSPWSECMSTVGLCGHGIQTRNMTCVADGGLPVNMSNCAPDPNVVVTKTERPCVVPCPGECVLTDWTEWNTCFVDCKDFTYTGFTRGVQSRSRAVLAYAQGKNNPPCPEQLWESRPCEAKTCSIFTWHTSPWTRSRNRRVWCRRSDGLLVTGGCSEISRPTEFLNCNPACSVLNSYCNDTDYCACQDPFQPVHDRLNTLVECVMDNSSSVPVVPKTVSMPEDGLTNVWMYAVIAAGTFFVIFLAIGCYTMSEYFHRGPRSRKKEEEEEKKNVEGGENIDGMIAETTLVSCNHVAPIATTNDLDALSVISADRSSTDSVGACNGHALAGGFAARACRQNAKSYARKHEFDVDYVDGDVVKVNDELHLEHALDFDVVSSGLEAQPSTACIIPKSKSYSALRNESKFYHNLSEVPKVIYVDGEDKNILSQSGKRHDSFDGMAKIKDAKNSKSDNEVANYTGAEYDDQAGGNAVHDIKSSSLRNLLKSFIGKIDGLSPKSYGGSQDFVYGNEIKDGIINSSEKELGELVPLLDEADDSGLASAPSTSNKLQQKTLSGGGNTICHSCGQKQSDMSDISLESFDRTSSLRSFYSLRSERMKSLSRNSGPIIQIVPEETNYKENQTFSQSHLDRKTVKPLEKLFQSGLGDISKQTVITNHNGQSKIGYAAFSSIDTENSSVGPSTSVSNGSLDSTADMTSDQSGMETSSKSPDNVNDRSRNVAIDSLRNAKHGKPLKDMPPEVEDSGLGASVGFEANFEDLQELNYELNGNCNSDSERMEPVLLNGNHSHAIHRENGLKAMEGRLSKQNVFGASYSPNGIEAQNLVTPSAFKRANIKTKRKALQQSRSPRQIDKSD